MKHLALLLFLFYSTFGFAQNFSISGKVVNQVTKAPLPGAHISLLHPWGEAFRTTVSKPDGSFEIDQLSRGGYALKISFVGYTDYQQEVTLSNQSINLGLLTMQEGVALDEVEITGKVPLAQQKGDTTQYNADAFKTLPDANAEELIEKMPGVVIQNGQVQAQGETVQEVLVDGKPFFGNDPTAALRNLPAEVIDKIQVFDKKSDQSTFTGFDDGETSKTINIITRPNMRNGQFGKLYAGGGYEEKYQLGGNASLFDGDRRISLIGQSNNINTQNFATEDLLGVVGSNSGRRGRGFGGRGGGGRRGGGNFRRGGGTSINDFLVQQQGGIATTHAFGINYSDQWSKKTQVSGSYFFNWTDNDSEEISRTEYITTESISEFYNEQNVTNTKNGNHRLHFRLEHQIDSANSIIIRPRLSWQQNRGNSNTLANSSIGEELLQETNNEYRTDLWAVDFSNSILFRHRFAKPRRTISINFGQGYKQNQGERNLLAEDTYYDGLPNPDTLDQLGHLDVQGWNLNSNVSYTEPVGRRGMLMLNYRMSYQEDDSDKETFDYAPLREEYDELNESLTNVFKNTFQSQQIGAGYNFRKGRNLMVMMRANAQWSELNSDQSFPSELIVKRNYFNILPMAMLRLRFDRQENLRIFYMGRTQSPSIEQLQEVVDNSNPLQLSVGNAALDQSYSHRIFTRYSKTNTDKASVFYFLLSATFSDNYIV